MPIQLGISNSLKSLVHQLSEQLETKTASVFQPVYIVTQTAGMNIWIKQQLAQKLGIAANIRFLKPNDAIHLLFQKLSGKYVSQSISAHDLNWIIFDILSEEEFKTNFQKIAEYYNHPGLEGEIKRMALAEKIADLFDQYQIYRAQEIENWNNGSSWESLKMMKNETDEAWQKYIWLKAREMAADKFSDKTYIGKYILEQLDVPEAVSELQKQVPALYFFGLSLITEYHLQIIYKVSDQIPVTFLFQNPAPWKYWYDDRSEKIIDFLKHIGKYDKLEEALGNPLLTGWGKLTQNTFKMFFKDDDTLNTLEDYGVAEPAQDCLLRYVQNTIFNNEKESETLSENFLNDGSITINSCYSPIREVEVLYNYLVHLVDQKHENLSARDIIVMVSDIDLYGSYIKAVFDNAPYKFPYTIADESFVVSDTLSNALVTLISLGEGQFTSEKVVGLLDFSTIRKRFQIDDPEMVRRVVQAANIRFGFSGNPENDTHYLSWEYGLDRIMYGLCMQGGELYGDGDTGFYPIDMVEGFDMFNIIRFVHFVRVLKTNIQNRKQNRTITEWVEFVEDCLATFIGEIGENPDEDYLQLQNQLEQYNRLDSFYRKSVDYEVFRYNFLPILSETRRSSNFASYGITFCSLIPMRSIPFKVVALLGMDLNKFPRLNHPVSFDLIEKKKQTGDRNIKENDKQLFLDTLLSAEDYFYVSYVGQSVKNNDPIPPSALVDELLEFIASQSPSPDWVRNHFIQRHPLHGFSKNYNTAENPKLYSYLLNQVSGVKKVLPDKKEFDMDFKEIQISALSRFLNHPAQGYYRSVLNIYYGEESMNLPEVEIFELEFLDSLHFKKQLITLSEEELPDFIEMHKKIGSLPLKNMASISVQKLRESIAPIREAYVELCEDCPEEQKDIRISLEGNTLSGKISGIFGNKIVRFVISNSSEKYLFDGFIGFLALIASGIEKEYYLISNDGTILKAKPVERNEAEQLLKYLITLYQKGHSELLPFHYKMLPKEKEKEAVNQEFFERKAFDAIIPGYTSGYVDIYLEKAINSGEFLKEGKFELYAELAMFFADLFENKFESVS